MSSVTTWPIFKTRLRNRYQVAERIVAFEFERPPGWSFKAGQFIDLTLIDPQETDAEGNVRAFSIASAPYQDVLTIATHMRETAFKRALNTAPVETEVKIEGPFGNFTLHENGDRAAVLLAGGIGATPFRSMVLQAARDRLPHRILLIHSNSRAQDAPFLEEFQAVERQNPNYTFVATMTETERPRRGWRGETGQIDWEMLSRHLKNILSPVFYIAGTPATVDRLLRMLHDAGIDRHDIRTEKFVGY